MNLPEPSAETVLFIQNCIPGKSELFMEKMKCLGSFLYEMNQQVNLTAIHEDGFWSRHVADSLSSVRFFPDGFKSGKIIGDLGCGAGFPSLVLAAAFPDIRFFAIDSTRKKIDFVSNAAQKMGLDNLTAVHGRGNELGRKEPFHHSLDILFARAVASADILIREGLAMLNKEGSLIIYRTKEQYESEIPFLKKWKKGSFHGTEIFDLPDQAGKRMFLQIKQIREMH